MIHQMPLTVKRSIELMGLVLATVVISQLQNIIMPMLMALVASIALLPVYRFFVRKKIPNGISIFLTILLLAIVLGLIVFFISSQIKPLIHNFTTIKLNIINHITALSKWLSTKTNLSTTTQAELIQQQTNNFLDSASNYLNNAMSSISTLLVFFGLFPIYTFFILYYKSLLRKFLLMWFKEEENLQVTETLKSIESIIQSYIVGLLIQFTYMTILLGGTLLIFGINYAFLIAIIFAILNLIPYVGALIGNILGVLLTLSSTPDLGPVFTVLITIGVVQVLDNNILMPFIVGSKIRINALVSLFGVFVGGALAGITGMFLSLPLMAVFKIIFDHTEQFKKWGVLFGDDKPPKNKYTNNKELTG
ncbi:MAG: AI-2E family transporter [bacterium]|nr:AI-2E family transporter [bacterium]